jgi:hypothetical protein
MPEKVGAIELPEVATAADLLKLGFEDDQLLLEECMSRPRDGSW